MYIYYIVWIFMYIYIYIDRYTHLSNSSDCHFKKADVNAWICILCVHKHTNIEMNTLSAGAIAARENREALTTMSQYVCTYTHTHRYIYIYTHTHIRTLSAATTMAVYTRIDTHTHTPYQLRRWLLQGLWQPHCPCPHPLNFPKFW